MDRTPDLPPSPGNLGVGLLANAQRINRAVLTIALVLLGVWIVHRFLPALAWAGVLAIAFWPFYKRLTGARPKPWDRILLPLLLTLLIGLIFTAPFIYVVIEGTREFRVIIHFLAEAQRNGISLPVWLPQLPLIGNVLADWWRANLSDPNAIQELVGHLDTRSLTGSARQYGAAILHRLILFGFMLLTLFFLFRDGARFSRQLTRLSDRLLGPDGERIGRHMVQAILATVNGLVLVGLGEGAVMGIAYIAAGLPHPVSIAALTGVLAVIPFGAPVAFGAVTLYLIGLGNTVAGIAVFCVGLVVVFVADHFIRPIIIGGAARLPFLWVLLGILGGLETFGIVGLFLGPAVMAALISLWRDWTELSPPEQPSKGTG
jgi:predicted PurR-regulated permease PerM